VISHPLDISDAWKNSYSENTNRKIWGAKFTARHPNLVALELSNFKCGHDSPIYSVVEEIVENSGTPIFNFKDLDENKPTGSIKIRVETISYFLTRYLENILKEGEARENIERQLEAFRGELIDSVKNDGVEIPILSNSTGEYAENVLTNADAV